MTSRPLDPSTSRLIDRFSRVKGSGTFSLDEFRALTGLEAPQALALISLGEQRGLLLCLAEGFYLLKPLPAPAKPSWADWRPPRAKLQAFLDLIPADRCIFPSDLIAASGLSKTLVSRYLRILLHTGNIIRKDKGRYRKQSSLLQQIPSWQQLVEAASCRLSAPTSQPLDPSTSDYGLSTSDFGLEHL